MAQRKVKFGVTLPQFGASWADAKECVLAAEEFGFDSVWVADHFFGVGGEDPLEAWTEMSAVAAITRRIEIGGGGEKVLLKLVARYADIWNNLGMAHGQIGQKLAVLRSHCERIGRRFEDIEISQQTIAAIGDTRDEANRRTEQVHQEVGFLTGAPGLCPTGMPNEIIERLNKNIASGIT